MMNPPDVRAALVAPARRPDFTRAVVCVLGLPLDAVTIDEAVERIRAAAFGARRCFLSTPNLNFAMTALQDASFRDSVLHSDLSLVDGMPLVWIARLLGQPLRGRVSGSDLFEALHAHPGPPINVYIFGGPPGAAAQASERINRRGGGLRCVGSDAAGFGSVDELSDDERIDRINRSGAHFFMISIGAARGQQWIERNASRVNVPVLAHLGAVVNFEAGTLRRAPAWMRSFGLEWLWRIKEEPSLWRRYARDGTMASKVLLTRVLPDAIEARRKPATVQAGVDVLRPAQRRVLKLHGDWRGTEHLALLRDALTALADESDTGLAVDLAGVTAIGSACTALLLLASGWWDTRGGFTVVASSPQARTALRRQLAAPVLLGSGSGSTP